MVPLGLANNPSLAWVLREKGVRHRVGSIVPSKSGMKCTPPMPDLTASWVSIVHGRRLGTTSRVRLDLRAKSEANHRKSASNSWTVVNRITLVPFSLFWPSTLCNTLNNPVPPGIEDHRSQLAQNLLLFLYCCVALEWTDGVQDLKESQEAARRHLNGHGCRVQQPSEDQFARGPRDIALKHLFDRWWLLAAATITLSKRRSTLSKEASRRRLTWRRLLVLPCTMPIKSST
jgi:hypothetical protein